MSQYRKPEKENITFEIDPDKKLVLDELVEALQHDHSQILNEAIASYQELYQWQLKEIERGIAAANAGDLIPHEQVVARWKEKRARLLDNPG